MKHILTLAGTVLLGTALGFEPPGRSGTDQRISIIELTWEGRSKESFDDVAVGNSLGSSVEDGLVLPLAADQVIFDNGSFTPSDRKPLVPPENQWASWPSYRGTCESPFETRRLRATFTLPVGTGPVDEVILFSPYYTDHGDIIPIDDNVYIFLNGTPVGKKGTWYGASNAGFAFANETAGWYQDGTLDPEALTALRAGVNVIDFVGEDFCIFGGLGRLNLKLVLPPSALCASRVPTISGTTGNDILIGTSSGDVISGLAGDDHIEGRGGNDLVCGNQGNDVILGGDGHDRLFGQPGNDGISGGTGNDLADGGDGDDTVEGNEDNDTIDGRRGFDRIDGGAGDDILNGGFGFDVLFGGLGRDQLFGQEDNDIVNGGSANDLVVGGAGNDRLGGQAGNDQLFGDAGDDRMDGGDDGDVCSGGTQVSGDSAVNCEVINGVP